MWRNADKLVGVIGVELYKEKHWHIALLIYVISTHFCASVLTF